MTPKSAVERELVVRLASVLWRLRRATAIETALFESVSEDLNPQQNRPLRDTFAAVDVLKSNRPSLPIASEPDDSPINEPSFDPKSDIADGFLRLATLPTCALDRLSRYEHTLWRQARQIVITLNSLRRRERKRRRPNFPFSFRASDR